MLEERQIEKLALNIAKIFNKYEVQEYTRIYYNKKCIINGDIDNIKENILGSEYTSWANDDLITITFDGSPLYYLINHSWFPTKRQSMRPLKDFIKLLDKNNLCYHVGDGWDLWVEEKPKEKVLVK